MLLWATACSSNEYEANNGASESIEPIIAEEQIIFYEDKNYLSIMESCGMDQATTYAEAENKFADVNLLANEAYADTLKEGFTTQIDIVYKELDNALKSGGVSIEAGEAAVFSFLDSYLFSLESVHTDATLTYLAEYDKAYGDVLGHTGEGNDILSIFSNRSSLPDSDEITESEFFKKYDKSLEVVFNDLNLYISLATAPDEGVEILRYNSLNDINEARSDLAISWEESKVAMQEYYAYLITDEIESNVKALLLSRVAESIIAEC